MIRKSVEVVKHMIVSGKCYPNLPNELKPYYIYFSDTGHSIMAIPRALLDKYPNAEMWELESAVPVKYVLTHQYDIVGNHLTIDVPYNDMYGVDVEEEYEEY